MARDDEEDCTDKVLTSKNNIQGAAEENTAKVDRVREGHDSRIETVKELLDGWVKPTQGRGFEPLIPDEARTSMVRRNIYIYILLINEY